MAAAAENEKNPSRAEHTFSVKKLDMSGFRVNPVLHAPLDGRLIWSVRSCKPQEKGFRTFASFWMEINNVSIVNKTKQGNKNSERKIADK